VNWNVFKFVILKPSKMIKETGRTVRGRLLQTSFTSFVRNLDMACDKLTATAMTRTTQDDWHDAQLLALTANTMFDAIFNTVFGRDEAAQFNSQHAFRNFQARTGVT